MSATGSTATLGFTDEDRVENIRRVAEVAKLMVDAGLIVIVSFISPFRSERRMARALVGEDEFIEVYSRYAARDLRSPAIPRDSISSPAPASCRT